MVTSHQRLGSMAVSASARGPQSRARLDRRYLGTGAGGCPPPRLGNGQREPGNSCWSEPLPRRRAPRRADAPRNAGRLHSCPCRLLSGWCAPLLALLILVRAALRSSGTGAAAVMAGTLRGWLIRTRRNRFGSASASENGFLSPAPSPIRSALSAPRPRPAYVQGTGICRRTRPPVRWRASPGV